VNVQLPRTFIHYLVVLGVDESSQTSKLIGSGTLDLVDVELDAGEMLAGVRPVRVRLKQLVDSSAGAEPYLGLTARLRGSRREQAGKYHGNRQPAGTSQPVRANRPQAKCVHLLLPTTWHVQVPDSTIGQPTRSHGGDVPRGDPQAGDVQKGRFAAFVFERGPQRGSLSVDELIILNALFLTMRLLRT
jgi:hypothetical protein